MGNDSVCAAGAALRDVDNGCPSAMQDCSDVVHLSVFFDGTGNNKETDEAPKRWSNVARMWLSADFVSRNKSSNAYSIYVSGVGTPFNGKPLSPSDEMKARIEDTEILGRGAGAGGTRRLGYGQQQINDALRGALLGKAKALGGQVAKYAEAGQKQSFADVNKALGKHRLVKQINVSIFGFSRGAALARAFCNRWLWECKEDHGKLSYEGYPIRFVFLGLFDTVASFGLPAANMPNNPVYGGFKGRDLVVDERVERCVHQVAAHELRFAFPVDLISRDGTLAGNWLEKVYPGVHSDVGGGYEPKDQSADSQGIDNNYGRIPMRDMMREALLHGSRLLGYDDIKKKSFKTFQDRFECKPETEAAYQAYTAVCDPGGTVAQQVQKHMEQLYSAYGSLHRQGGESLTQRQHREGKSWSRLAPDDMAKELDNYNKARKDRDSAFGSLRSVVDPTYMIRKGVYALWITPKKWQLAAWHRSASTGVMGFVHAYLHDSKVGFMSNAEPFSYFSKRGVSESTRSVQGWFEDNVARPVDHAYDATRDAANRGIERGKKAAKEAQEAVAAKAQQAKEAIAETADKAQKAATEAAHKAQKAASEAARKAQEVATKAARKTQEVANATVQKGQQAMQSAGNAIGRTTQDAVGGLKSAWQFLTQ